MEITIVKKSQKREKACSILATLYRHFSTWGCETILFVTKKLFSVGLGRAVFFLCHIQQLICKSTKELLVQLFYYLGQFKLSVTLLTEFRPPFYPLWHLVTFCQTPTPCDLIVIFFRENYKENWRNVFSTS